MFHSLAPTGLSPPTRQKVYHLENDFNQLFMDFLKKLQDGFDVNDSNLHCYFVELVKYIKKLLMDGLLKKYPSFWSFVSNFLSSFEKKHVHLNCKNKNPGIQWIKNSIEEKTLVFQIRSFAASPRYVLDTYYEKTAWIRNPVNYILDELDIILNNNDISFVEKKSNHHIPEEPIPVAEISDSKETDTTNHVNKNGNILSLSQTINDDEDNSECINGDVWISKSLREMTRDLPPVDVNDLSNDLNYFNNYNDFGLDEDKTIVNQVDYNETLSTKTYDHSEADDVDMVVNEKTIEMNAVYSEGNDSSTDKITEHSDEFFQVVDGEFTFEQSDVLQFGLYLFKENGERYIGSFSVFCNHSTGCPENRIYLLTDRYLYLLYDKKDNLGNYSIALSIKLKMIEFIAVGVDYQSINIYCRGLKFKTEHSDHVVKNFTIETASSKLGKKIIWLTKKAYKMGNINDPQIVTKGTDDVMALRKFLRSQSNSDVKILFHTLIYWKEIETNKINEMEGYIQIRLIKPGLFKSYSEWAEVYAALKEGILYQYTDSSCKEAISVKHLRRKINHVYDIEIENDEKYVICIPFVDQEGDLQISCPTMEAMKDWKNAFNLSVDMNVRDMTVPCTLTVYNTSFILSQAGNNFLIDGFIRTLKHINFTNIKHLLTIIRNNIYIVVLVYYDLTSEWFYMRNLSELERFKEIIDETEIQILNLECERDHPYLVPYLHNLQSPFNQNIMP